VIQKLFPHSVTAARLLLAVQYLMNGGNWWIKMLPFPNIGDPHSGPTKHPVIFAMIDTGWMFQLAKATELLTGVALLFNVFVPLMLVVSMPVAITTFLIDAFIFDSIVGWFAGTVTTHVVAAKVLDLIFFGGVVLAMQAYLMFAYLDCYRPMLALRPKPRCP
jgi:hypothetical protein